MLKNATKFYCLVVFCALSQKPKRIFCFSYWTFFVIDCAIFFVINLS